MTAFTNTWNAAYEASPSDSDNISQGALRIREFKTDIKEREEVDHSWAGNVDDGAHKKVTFVDPLAAKPTQANDETYLYSKDVLATSELFYEDEAGNEIQLTTGGKLNMELATNYLFTGKINFEEGINYLVASGTDTYTAVLVPAITAYKTGAQYNILIANTNTSTTPTINLNTLGALTITKSGGAALIPGDMPAGHEAIFRKTAAGVELLNPIYQSGSVVQVVNTQVSAVATGTTNLAGDDTIPQNTEGDEYMTLAITPKATNSILLITVSALLSHNQDVRFNIALFQDTTANALAATQFYGNGASANIPAMFNHKMTAGTVAATTFKVRAGATSGQMTFNGNGGSRLFGGVASSSITITEIAA